MNPPSPDRFIANYHTHTPRCMHATGTEEEYILRAVGLGYDCLGFSDHTPWPYRSGFVSRIRMPIDALDGYVDTLRGLREKYADRIRVLIGLECESFPEFYGWIERAKRDFALDYVLLGNHYDTNDDGGMYFGQSVTPAHLAQYAKMTIRGMETGLYSYLAHPDLALYHYPAFDTAAEDMCRAICEAAERLDMPLEYNGLGHRRQAKSREYGCVGYCSEEFWRIASEYKVRAIFGVDAHAVDDLDCLDIRNSAQKKLSAAGLTVTDKLDGITFQSCRSGQ